MSDQHLFLSVMMFLLRLSDSLQIFCHLVWYPPGGDEVHGELALIKYVVPCRWNTSTREAQSTRLRTRPLIEPCASGIVSSRASTAHCPHASCAHWSSSSIPEKATPPSSRCSPRQTWRMVGAFHVSSFHMWGFTACHWDSMYVSLHQRPGLSS